MRVGSKKLQDKMHEKMYFVYDENVSQWKLVNMQSIVEKQKTKEIKIEVKIKGDVKMDDVVVIIPAYKPHKEIMMDFIERLKKRFKNIVVVDDGSGIEYEEFFKLIETKDIAVLKHNINLGKGRAIKTAFNYCLKKSKFKYGKYQLQNGFIFHEVR